MSDERLMMVTIRECRPSDLAILRELAVRTFDEAFRTLVTPEIMQAYLQEAFSPARLDAELRQPASNFYFLYVEEMLAGYFKVNEAGAQTDLQDPASLELERIYVQKAFQGQGLGRIMLADVERIARQRGKTYIWLGVWELNTSAIAFYERYGFRKTGTHDFYMGGERQTDYLMRLDLGE